MTRANNLNIQGAARKVRHFRWTTRRRIVLYAGVVLLFAFIAWGIIGGLKIRSAAADVAAIAAEVVPDEGEAVNLETIRRSAQKMEEASEILDSLDIWILPFKITGPLLRMIPAIGGDASELPGLIDFVSESARGGEPVLAVALALADSGVSASNPDLGLLRSVFESHRTALEEGDTALQRAAAARVSIDVDRLSDGTRDRLATADRLYEVARAGANIVLAVPGALEDVDELRSYATDLLDLASGEGVSAAISLGPQLLLDRERIFDLVDSLTIRLDEIRPDLVTLEPFLPVSLTELDEAVDFGTQIINGFSRIGDALDSVRVYADSGFGDNPENSERLGDALVSLIDEADAMHELVQTPPEFPGLSEIPEGGVEALSDLSRLGQFMYSFFGFKGARLHLILAQDEEELRPSGGFFGALWTLELDRGRLVDRRFISSYEVDGDINPRFWGSAPYSFTLGLGSFVIPFRDMNWWADFPFAVDRMGRTYILTQKRRPDTFIAINQSALESLLDGLGSLTVAAPADELTISGATAREFLREGIDPKGADVPETWDDQRFASYLLGNAIIDSLTGDGGAGTDSLVATMVEVARKGDLLIVTNNPAGRGLFRKLGWDGALLPFDYDGFYVVESNAYSAKISHTIERQYRFSSTLDASGESRSNLAIILQNPALPTGEPCRQAPLTGVPECYWALIRVYVSEDATETRAPDLPLPAGTVRSLVQPAGSQTGRVSDGADGLPFHVDEILGLVVVPPGEVTTMDMDWKLSGAAKRSSDGVWRYDVQVPRQPGLRQTTVAVDVTLPPDSCLVGSTMDVDLKDGKVAYISALESDQTVTIWYGIDAATCQAAGSVSQ